ncbi:hypothetical protein SDC9_174990 [bioreactor metagenome]|uniref:Uncharacterized protein n=1 Tax=bioreactor metagenome TaxID=1076179 RepID=A0A645GMY8_9ZZZZ
MILTDAVRVLQLTNAFLFGNSPNSRKQERVLFRFVDIRKGFGFILSYRRQKVIELIAQRRIILSALDRPDTDRNQGDRTHGGEQQHQ